MRINAIYRTVSSRGFAVAVFFTTILSVLASVSLPTVRADVEPNDDFATAEAVTPGTHTGALDSVDVNDYYKTTLTASGQTVYVNVTVPGSLTMDLNLYDGGLQEVDNDIGVVG